MQLVLILLKDCSKWACLNIEHPVSFRLRAYAFQQREIQDQREEYSVVNL